MEMVSQEQKQVVAARGEPHMKLHVKNFKPHKSSTSSFDKFFTCKQKSSETVREYTTRLRLAGRRTVADRPQPKAAKKACVFEENLTAMFEKALQYTEDEAQNEQMLGRIIYAQAIEDRGSQVRGVGPPAESHRARDSKCFICRHMNPVTRECFQEKQEEMQRSERYIQNVSWKLLVDTGASVTILKEQCFRRGTQFQDSEKSV
ncbi:hypothetical protein PR048_023509 [Dryococelus australis]|uniref:Peptidase A2 domain-containing protein n=1 Tax=Dryococelus australis TaxID=614101 RepID=A0ABQ9GUD3_9NEOP|nr:hypothetical protein PR048_023509 [Dryococelus australis]